MALVYRYRCECGELMGHDSEEDGFVEFMANADRLVVARFDPSIKTELRCEHDGEIHKVEVLPPPRSS